MRKQHRTMAIIIGLVALFGLAFWYADQAGERANEGVTIAAHVKGNPEAAVELVKYSDFTCPACARAAQVVDQILEVYGDDIRFEYRYFPLVTVSPLAVPTARAAEAAAQQGKFWEMHDLLFTNQQTLLRSANPSTLFVSYAEELELDVPTFRRHMGASMIEDYIREQYREAQAAGLTATPTFVLNGERMQFETFDQMIAQIEAAIGATATTAPATSTATSTDTSTENGAPAESIEFSL